MSKKKKKINRKRVNESKASEKKVNEKIPCKENAVEKKINKNNIRRSRIWKYRIVSTVVIPLAIIFLLELGLRTIGFGFNPAPTLSCKYKGGDAYRDNFRFMWRFFPRTIAREFDPFIFPAEKAKDTFRIFVMGGSAAHGVPDASFSFYRYLRVMLEKRYPGIRFEVIGTTATAVNSHVVLEIAKDCSKRKPDLFVIYMGNNEVLGPYGAGTVFAPLSSKLSLIRWGIFFKGTRLGQLLARTAKAIGKGKKKPVVWRGLEMFLKKQVRKDDVRLESVYDHFHANLEDIIYMGRDSGTSLIVSTVAVNLKDCPPFASLHDRGLPAGDKEKWDRLYTQGTQYEQQGDFKKAKEKYLAASAVDSGYADLQFRLARCFWHMGAYENARTSYINARESDTLRFRADSRINRIIRETVSAAAQASQKVRLCDAESLFNKNSTHGLPGETFFYEHVHLNFKGNYLLALAVFNEVEKILPPRVKNRKAGSGVLSEEECLRLLACSLWDRLNIAEDVLYNYIRKAPYCNQLYHDERIRRLEMEFKELRDRFTPETMEESLEFYRSAVEASPHDPWLRRKYARFLLMELNQLEEAARQYRKIKELLPHFHEGYAGLGMVLRGQRKLDEAVVQFREAIRLHPFQADVYNNLAFTYQLQGKIHQALDCYTHTTHLNPRYTPAYTNMGLLLTEQGKVEEAVALCRKGVKVVPDSWRLHHHLGYFLFKQGNNEAAVKALSKALEIAPDASKTRALLDKILLQNSQYNR